MHLREGLFLNAQNLLRNAKTFQSNTLVKRRFVFYSTKPPRECLVLSGWSGRPWQDIIDKRTLVLIISVERRFVFKSTEAPLECC